MAYHTNKALHNCAFCYILLACIVSQRQPQKSRSTGHGNAWTRPDSTGADEAPATEADTDKETRRQRQQQSHPEIKARSGTPEEPEPARQQQRHDRQQTLSPTRAAEIEPEPESQKRGTVDHERRRRQREGKERKEERERRENDSKTPLFSPSHRTPSRSTTRASPAPTDTDSSRNAAFFGSAFVEYAELTEINASFDHTKDGGRFTFSRPQQRQKFGFVPSSPRLYLFHQTPFLKHTVHQRYILLQT